LIDSPERAYTKVLEYRESQIDDLARMVRASDATNQMQLEEIKRLKFELERSENLNLILSLLLLD
jgi:hypothetical protein